MVVTFGQWLKRRREALGISTQVDLRDRLKVAGLEVTKRAISKWELDQAVPSKRSRDSLWRALGVYGQTRTQLEMALDGWAQFPQQDAA